ncbi:MAG: hypothetical protein N2510_07880 [Ignavibacteria bacterium]|nr:hypothetical protein [Ignavibacteria bacterium]
MSKETIHKHRMDFYYQSLVIYLIFFVVYVLIKWSYEDDITVLLNDPLFYILILFIAIFLIVVVINIIKSPMIILRDDRIVFKNRFGSREVMFSDIINVKIGRRRNKGEEITYRIIKLKLKHRRKPLKIRANEFERGNELIKEFLKIKGSVN